MNGPPPAGTPRQGSPRWLPIVIGAVGILAGSLHLLTAFTSGPLGRNLILGGIWAGMGLLMLTSGLLLLGRRDRDR